MESVTPTFAESDIGEYIRVVMAEDIPVAFGYEYQCVFNGQYVSPDTLVSGSDIDCFTPPNMPTGAGTVRVDVKGVGQWSSNTLPFEFYRTLRGLSHLFKVVKYALTGYNCFLRLPYWNICLQLSL
jgi:hypothetical protein